MFAENTAAFLADFGVSATFGSYTPLVIFDEPESEILGSRALSTEYEILYRTADLPGFVHGSLITVNAQVYQCIDAKTIDDGVFSRASLEI